MKISSLSFIAISLTILLVACNKEIDVGIDLIGDKPIDADFIDTFEITSKTIYGDTLIRFKNDQSYSPRTFLIGELDDPVFGKTTSKVFVSPRFISQFPDLNGLTLDSAVLVFNVDTLSGYGNVFAQHNLSLHRLIEAPIISETDSLLAYQCIDYDPSPISTIRRSGDYNDSIEYYNPRVDTIVKEPNQLRFRLDNDIWQSIGEDTLLQESTQAIINEVKGYALVSQPDESSMFSLDLSSVNSANIQLYFLDSIQRSFLVPVGGAAGSTVIGPSLKHSCYTHDYSSVEIDAAIDDTSQPLNYVQGLQGVSVEYDLSSILTFDKTERLINYAELELFAREDLDNDLISQLIAYYRNEDGELNRISDILLGFAPTNFDGALNEEDSGIPNVRKYRIILTQHIINMLENNVSSGSIIVEPDGKIFTPNQTVFFSADHPDYPAKLKIFSTKP